MEVHVTRQQVISSAGTAVLILVAATALATDEGFSVTTTPGQQKRGAALGAPELHLSLDQAVALALGHNINLEVSRLSLASAGEGVLAASGIFDPYVKMDLSESSAKSPATNQLQGAAVNVLKQRAFDLSLGQLLPTGAQASIAWTNSRTETNSTFFFLNPSYDSGLNLSLTQPLLKGFGTDVNRTTIEVSRRNREISRMQFEQIVITTLQKVEDAYWNLVYAKEDLKVEQESLKLAQDLLDQTRTRVRIGTLAPIDIVQSEATVAAREQAIILAENAVADAADVLKSLMGFENADDWQSAIVPVDTLEVTPRAENMDKAIATALDRRLELKIQEVQEAIARDNLLVADNATKPQLDLALGYGYSGVGGTLSELDSTTGLVTVTPGGWNDALRQIRNRDFDQWSIGVNLTYPLGNNEARASLAEQRFALATTQQQRALARQSVIYEVRGAVRGLEAGVKSIAAAVKARELAERNLDAEQKKFANGMSTNYQVLKIQEDLATAQVAELQSRVSYRQTTVGYEVAVGTLLQDAGVKLNEEPPAKAPHTFWSKAGWLKYGHWAKVGEGTEEEPPSAAGKQEEPAKEQER
jgi:outer membrane protein